MPENKKYKVIEASHPGNLAEKLSTEENAEYELANDIHNYSDTLVVILARKTN